MAVTSKHTEVVNLDYKDLEAGVDLSSFIDTAFGSEGIGLLLVRNVPHFVEQRQRLLNLATAFVALPDEVKERCVHRESNYSFGWSHGKESLKAGSYDTHKGSYYNNPQYDTPCTDPELIRRFPASCHPNVWPDEDACPGLRTAFCDLGKLIVSVGTLVARQCDLFVSKRLPEGHPLGLEKLITDSLTCKARLLHYFPIRDDGERQRDSWCSWHCDSGALTGLCPAMYINLPSGEEITCPDPEAGLYVRDRSGAEFRVPCPSNCIAFQIGECSQIQSGGLLLATPHSVQALRAPDSYHIGRNTFAVFMQPGHDFVLSSPAGMRERLQLWGTSEGRQFLDGMSFAEFMQTTMKFYYERDGDSEAIM